MSPAKIVLSPADVHVWTTTFESCDDPAWLDQCASLLSEQERIRWQRFVFPRDRHAFLVSRALVRSVLGRITGLHPAQLRFDAGEHGKPHLAHEVSADWPDPPCFNLSHTRGMAVLAVSNGRQVGVDVECMDRPASFDVAQRFFSASESQALQGCVPSAREERFWSLWTLKESYLKATGQGLHAALDEFSFDFSEQGRVITLSGQPAWRDRPGRWWLGQWLPSTAHMAAICIERGDHLPPPVIHAHRLIPLLHEQACPVDFIRTTP